MAMEKISDLNQSGNYTTVFTGDYVDRGPWSSQVLNILIAPPFDGSKRACIQGNHDEMMVRCMPPNSRSDWERWCVNGGEYTLDSYAGGCRYNRIRPSKKLKTHMAWLKQLPVYYETNKYVFVHTHAPKNEFDLEVAANDASLKDLMQWQMYLESDTAGYRGKHVVHGQVSSKDNPKTYGNLTNIDAFALFTCGLAVCLFDDDVGGPPVKTFFVTGIDGLTLRGSLALKGFPEIEL